MHSSSALGLHDYSQVDRQGASRQTPDVNYSDSFKIREIPCRVKAEPLLFRVNRCSETVETVHFMCSEAGSCWRLIDSCITLFKAQGPARTCNESKEEEEEVWLVVFVALPHSDCLTILKATRNLCCVFSIRRGVCLIRVA